MAQPNTLFVNSSNVVVLDGLIGNPPTITRETHDGRIILTVTDQVRGDFQRISLTGDQWDALVSNAYATT